MFSGCSRRVNLAILGVIFFLFILVPLAVFSWRKEHAGDAITKISSNKMFDNDSMTEKNPEKNKQVNIWADVPTIWYDCNVGLSCVYYERPKAVSTQQDDDKIPITKFWVNSWGCFLFEERFAEVQEGQIPRHELEKYQPLFGMDKIERGIYVRSARNASNGSGGRGEINVLPKRIEVLETFIFPIIEQSSRCVVAPNNPEKRIKVRDCIAWIIGSANKTSSANSLFKYKILDDGSEYDRSRQFMLQVRSANEIQIATYPISDGLNEEKGCYDLYYRTRPRTYGHRARGNQSK
jgi:hypothetical protein